MRSRPATLAFATAALFACSQPGPSQRAWPVYSTAVTAILQEYDTAMNEIANVDIALSAPNPAPKGGIQPMNNDQAVADIEKTVIPMLDKAAGEANGIEFKTESDLSRLHQFLVQGLAVKADAYKTLVAAFRAKNAESFDAGVGKLTQADALMGQFRSCFQEGRMNGGPPRCDFGRAAPTSTQESGVATPVTGLPQIPGMNGPR